MQSGESQKLLYRRMNDFNDDILKFLICPKNRRKVLFYDKKENILHTSDKKNIYKIKNGVPFNWLIIK